MAYGLTALDVEIHIYNVIFMKGEITMILCIRKTNNFEQVENFLLSHPDKEYKTSRFVYYFKQVGDCAGIFRRATETCTRRGRKAGDEIIAYYHDGEY